MQNRGKSDAYAKEKRKIYREPTVKGRKLGLKSMVWSRRKKNIQPEQNEETRIQENGES